MALVNLPLNSKGHPCPHWWRCHFSALMFTPLLVTAVKWYSCRDWDNDHKNDDKKNLSQDLASKALLSSQLGICGITCVSIADKKCYIWQIWKSSFTTTSKQSHPSQTPSDDCSRWLLHNLWEAKALQAGRQDKDKCPEDKRRCPTAGREFEDLASKQW